MFIECAQHIRMLSSPCLVRPVSFHFSMFSLLLTYSSLGRQATTSHRLLVHFLGHFSLSNFLLPLPKVILCARLIQSSPNSAQLYTRPNYPNYRVLSHACICQYFYIKLFVTLLIFVDYCTRRRRASTAHSNASQQTLAPLSRV